VSELRAWKAAMTERSSAPVSAPASASPMAESRRRLSADEKAPPAMLNLIGQASARVDFKIDQESAASGSIGYNHTNDEMVLSSPRFNMSGTVAAKSAELSGTLAAASATITGHAAVTSLSVNRFDPASEALTVVGATHTIGRHVSSVTFSVFFSSGTHKVATITGPYGSGTAAVASLEYACVYSYAGVNHCIGTRLASTRRTKSNTEWAVDSADAATSGHDHHPTLRFSNGVLELVVATYVQVTGVVRVTAHTASIVRNYQASPDE